ncbi:MAG: cytochrome c biogenesis protein CcdA [Anaerolineae bacterium]|nr:cytochrome c biogenesis protein CcdA [Anaerolineae bacterium]
MINVTLGLAFLFGLISFLSPCVLPLVPAYIGYMGGRVTQTVAAQTGGGGQIVTDIGLVGRLSTLMHGLAFVAGFTTIFVTLGLATTAFLSVIGGQNVRIVEQILAHAGGLFIILMALHMLGVLRIIFRRAKEAPALLSNPAFSVAATIVMALVILWALVEPLIAIPVIALVILWLAVSNAYTAPGTFWNGLIDRVQSGLYADTRRQMVASGKQNFISSFFMGMVFSAGWTPCIGPIYGSILTMAATGGNVGEAGAQLIAYSLGLGIPFLLAALLLDGAQAFLRKLQRHIRTIERFAGVLLLVIGIAIASGEMQALSRNFANEFADFSTNLEECVLSIVQGERPIGEFNNCMDTAQQASDGSL